MEMFGAAFYHVLSNIGCGISKLNISKLKVESYVFGYANNLKLMVNDKKVVLLNDFNSFNLISANSGKQVRKMICKSQKRLIRAELKDNHLYTATANSIFKFDIVLCELMAQIGVPQSRFYFENYLAEILYNKRVTLKKMHRLEQPFRINEDFHSKQVGACYELLEGFRVELFWSTDHSFRLTSQHYSEEQQTLFLLFHVSGSFFPRSDDSSSFEIHFRLRHEAFTKKAVFQFQKKNEPSNHKFYHSKNLLIAHDMRSNQVSHQLFDTDFAILHFFDVRPNCIFFTFGNYRCTFSDLGNSEPPSSVVDTVGSFERDRMFNFRGICCFRQRLAALPNRLTVEISSRLPSVGRLLTNKSLRILRLSRRPLFEVYRLLRGLRTGPQIISKCSRSNRSFLQSRQRNPFAKCAGFRLDNTGLPVQPRLASACQSARARRSDYFETRAARMWSPVRP